MSGILDLMQRARAASSLDDFGDDSFREGLERLVESADREARLTERGRMGFEMQIVDLLVNRLQVEHWYRLHPEIDQQQIVAPLIGLGLPRTGRSEEHTSELQSLMRISYAVFCLKKKNKNQTHTTHRIY